MFKFEAVVSKTWKSCGHRIRNSLTMYQSKLYLSSLGKSEYNLKMKENYGLFIDGKFCESSDGSTFKVENPANGNILCSVASAQEDDVNRAIEIAHKSFEDGIWRNLSLQSRFEILNNIANILRDNIYDIALLESLQTGRPIREMNAQLKRLPEWFEYYGSLLRTFEGTIPPFQGDYLNYVERIPLGIVGLITPWNHPMLIAIKKISVALATGNSIICKPSELAPCSIIEFGKLLSFAGLPNGVFNVIPGYGHIAGKTLSQSKLIKKIDITGGTETGKIIGKSCGENLSYFTAELGGKSPVIIFEDIINDEQRLNECINGIIFASFIASGQTCIMASKYLIHENIYDIILEKLIKKISKIKYKQDPQNNKTQFGPIISLSQRDKIIKFVDNAKKEGAKILIGGKIPEINNTEFDDGYYYEATLIGDCNDKMQCVNQEIFGPIVCLLKFKNESQAIEICNNSEYGLSAGIWTQDIKIAHRVANKLNVGIIWINSHHRNDASSPWGGTKNSGIGRENGFDAFREYTQSKSIIVNYSDQNFDWFIDDDNIRYC